MGGSSVQDGIKVIKNKLEKHNQREKISFTGKEPEAVERQKRCQSVQCVKLNVG